MTRAKVARAALIVAGAVPGLIIGLLGAVELGAVVAVAGPIITSLIIMWLDQGEAERLRGEVGRLTEDVAAAKREAAEAKREAARPETMAEQASRLRRDVSAQRSYSSGSEY